MAVAVAVALGVALAVAVAVALAANRSRDFAAHTAAPALRLLYIYDAWGPLYICSTAAAGARVIAYLNFWSSHPARTPPLDTPHSPFKLAWAKPVIFRVFYHHLPPPKTKIFFFAPVAAAAAALPLPLSSTTNPRPIPTLTPVGRALRRCEKGGHNLGGHIYRIYK